MTVNKFQTEWIVAHLLFPNSAQAREIYLFIAEALTVKKPQAVTAYEKNVLLFKIIFEFFLKTQVVQSGQSFSEFKNQNIKLWPMFYKKLSKHEALLVIGVVFLELKATDLSKIFRSSEKQIKNKFDQIISKLIPKRQTTAPEEFKFKYRTVHQTEKSDFTYYEEILNAVFCNDKASLEQIQQQIKADLKINLIKYVDQLCSFKDEFEQLNAGVYNILELQLPQQKQATTPFKRIKNLPIYLPTSFIAIATMVLLFFRPQFIQESFSSDRNEAIEIQQVKIDRHSEQNESILPSEAQNKNETLAEAKVGVAKTATAVDNAETTKPEPLKVEPLKQVSASKTVPPVVVVKAETKIPVKNKSTTSAGVFRGKMLVTDVQQVQAAVREKIINLGGKKAGEVELGWMKNETTSYFHFSFPEDNKTELENYLKQFGTVQLAFEPHPRVMPKGVNRYIIEIKQNE